MPFNDDQHEYPLPGSSSTPPPKRESAELLPRYFRTQPNKKFLNATLDQLTQPGVAEKLSGYFGRRIAKAYQADDTYIAEHNSDRQNYQLEPAAVVKDELDNILFYKDYLDYINQTKAFGGTTTDHSIFNSQEYYAWNPNIDWDKFTNFREYYWLPSGPIGLGIVGQANNIVSTYTVTKKDNLDNNGYVFTPDGLTQNPTLKLYRGQTYIFDIDAQGMPLTFRTARSLDPSLLYSKGLDDSTQTVDVGTITWTVDITAPDTLYYVNGNDLNASGLIQIADAIENSSIDVEKEIIGKKTYTMTNGHALSNGMKVYFQGTVTPTKYATGEWYVEGVGTAIQLINEKTLEIPATYSTDKPIPFDTEAFDRLPYSNANSFAGTKDYLLVNRASSSRSPWSRYNRWFHKDVIETISAINGTPSEIDQNYRAKRPIIEFIPGLKLNNFGTSAKDDIDLLDTFTKDVFSDVEGQIGYNIDGIDVVDNMRILFTADKDSRVEGKIFKVKFITHNLVRQISLIEETDTNPIENETVLILNGNSYKGKMWYYTGTVWKAGQDKTAVNQTPLFELYDGSGYSFSNSTYYPSSTFIGNKVFSYKLGSGIVKDSELGFSVSYRALENTGDILFNFDLLNSTYTYQQDNAVKTANTDTGLLRVYTAINTFTYTSGWTKAKTESVQPVCRQYVVDFQDNDFAVDVYDKSGDINDLSVTVYVNNVRKHSGTHYVINRINGTAFITFVKKLVINDIVVLKTKSATKKNANGYYEIPINLERNPLNNNVSGFTLGEVSDHVLSITEGRDDFTGAFPGANNLRDLGDLTRYGTRFVQHSGPVNLALYHLTDQSSNVVHAVRFASKEYGKFRRIFLQEANMLGFDGETKEHFDRVMKKVVNNKTNDMPFYFSDMIGIGTSARVSHLVADPDIIFFALSKDFNLTTLSSRAVGVYKNGIQLLEGKDYIFDLDNPGFVSVTVTKAVGDIIDVYEYEKTDGSFIPQTPTKLGLYPKFEPAKFIDDTYQIPTEVIQGHDGNIFVCYGDFRDDLLLELEKRIYNNIKTSYDATIIDRHEFVGGESRNTGFTKWQRDKALITDFTNWLDNVSNIDYTDYSFYDRTNSFTFNYGSMTSPKGAKLPGYWRAIYKEAYDTDRPHSHPWEMLGYSLCPTWWSTVYGPAPWTSENKILWQDVEDGLIREPNKALKYVSAYARKDITKHIPVNNEGKLLSPLDSNFAKNYVLSLTQGPFEFGDEAPTETAWRRSSEYPFAFLLSWILNQPTKIIGLGFDRSRIIRNSANEIVYSTTSKRIRLKDLVFPSTQADKSRVSTSGIVNYIADYIGSRTLTTYTSYKENLKAINNQLGFKVAGFTEKSKFKLLLDSRTPYNEGNVFIPDENYKVFLNTSSVVDLVSYSGIIIEKQPAGFIVKGYNKNNPYFKYFKHFERQGDRVEIIGGVTDSFVTWKAGQTYVQGQTVSFNNEFFRVKTQHFSDATFNSDNFAKLFELPVTGGRSAIFRSQFDTTVTAELSYGHLFRTVQEVIDFILGYEQWLIFQGFDFNYFNRDINAVENWELSSKEFLFWTTQNWNASSIITLSPGANRLKFNRDLYASDNVFGNFYEYSLLKADGRKLLPEFVNVFRSNSNDFQITTRNSADGVYFVQLPLLQKEHIVLLDNYTVFSDIIYDLEPGYRQERIKVLGYRTDDWNGTLNIPGFIFDNAICTEWKSYQDYDIGDTVHYKEFYYIAKIHIPGTESFEAESWVRLSEKPESDLIPNLDYKAKQFKDYYDLDTDNFDTDQQKIAQHLIGYQKRQYLSNIIHDDVSQYKFYQGFIQDKGTKNSLTKLFDALSSADKDSIEFYEEWALKLGQYGSSEAFDEIEFKLDEAKFKLSPQPLELVDTVSGAETDLIYRQRPFEVYLKPNNYTHSPFPTKYKSEDYIPTAGFVNEQDVKLILAKYDDILSQTITNLNVGDYIWVGLRGVTWDVVKYISTSDRVLAVSSDADAGTTTFKLNTQARYTVDEIIGILDVAGAEKFYKVKNVSLDNLICYENDTTADVEIANGFITKFISSRVSNLTEANSKVLNTELKAGEIIWVDDDDSSRWVVLENTPVYSSQQILSNPETADYPGDGFGKVIASNDRNTILIVSAEVKEKVYVYLRASDNVNYYQSQELLAPTDLYTGSGNFGSSLALTDDGDYLVIGAPNASNVKTKYTGAYDTGLSYVAGDIVSHLETHWEAQWPITAATGALTFPSFYSTSVVHDTNYNAGTNSYPTIAYAIRGDYNLDVSTTHILVRAPVTQFDGSATGDSIQLNWNQYSQNYPSGVLPWGATGPGVSAFEGTKTIAAKIDAVLYVDNLIRVPAVGDTLSSSSALGEVAYIRISDSNKAIIYMQDVSGQFGATDTITLNANSCGVYTLINPSGASATFDGWWKIDGFPAFTTSLLGTFQDITIPNFVIQDYITQAESRSPVPFSNTMDEVYALNQTSDPTKGGRLGYLSFYNKNGLPDLSELWFLRSPKSFTDTANANDTFRIRVNTIRGGADPISVFDPISLGLSFTYLNDSTHTIFDLWSGFVDVTFTNFDLSGVPYVPQIGEIIVDNTTGATAEVVYIQEQLLTARLYVKNRVGTFSFGVNNGATSTISIKDKISVGVNRLSGRLDHADMDSATTGKMVIVKNDDSAFLLIGASTFQNELEVHFYSTSTVTGIARTPNYPVPLNKDWKQLYNIPTHTSGTAGSYTNEGMYCTYNKTRNGQYSFQHGYIVPDRGSNKYLGKQMSFASKDKFHHFYISTNDVNTVGNAGRVYFVNHGVDATGTTFTFSLGKNKNYKGPFSDSQIYYENDIVLHEGLFYQSKTNLSASVFDSTVWTLLSSHIDYVGHIPNDSGLGVDSETVIDRSTLTNFADTFATNKTGDVLGVVAKFTGSIAEVIIYRDLNGHYEYSQSIETPTANIGFATSIAISDNASLLAIGCPLDDTVENDNGVVYIYKLTNGEYTLNQTLYSPETDVAERFGVNLDFDNDNLIVSAKGGDLISTTTFDSNTTIATTLDNNLTQFKSKNEDSGQVLMFQRFNDTLIYSERFVYNNPTTRRFGDNILFKNNHVYVSMPELTVTPTDNNMGTILDFKRNRTKQSWTTLRKPIDQVDVKKYKGVFIYNTETQKLTKQIDYIDPIQGKIAGPAEEELSFKTPYDPAVYTTGVSPAVVDEGNFWADKYIGKLWWDLSTVKFYNPYQGNIIYQTANWNRLFTGASIDIYEWVETVLKPSQWLDQADTEEGLAKGISGTPKYDDNTLVTAKVFDKVGQSFSNKYYYWVKNRKFIPEKEFRKTSAFDVAQLIEDPQSQGYQYIAPFSNNRFALYNCLNLVSGDSSAINFRYWTIDNPTNIHNEYQLISDGLDTSRPKAELENKWFDSLIGWDKNFRLVPDDTLSKKQKYGILNSPRQTMFVNRLEAVKQFVERVNTTLAKHIIVGEYDLSNLELLDPLPTTNSGLFDATVDTFGEIGFVGTAKVKQAVLTPTWEDGKLVNVIITDPGRGYKVPPSYDFMMIGSGTGAEITLTIDTLGKVNSAVIKYAGKEYSPDATIDVRKFSALVKADETVDNKWSIFSYNTTTLLWDRTSSQSYNVKNYWNYVDWYKEGYSWATDVTHLIDESYQLTALDDSVGDIVKIKTVGSGGWLLLRKISNAVAVDYTTNYETIGKHNGTINFATSLYNYPTFHIGYDSLSYDTADFDNQPVQEFRILLETLRDDIYIDDLAIEYNKLFFANIRYAFSEQLYVDWAFKSSFLKAKHNIGDLSQKVNFQNDNLSSYQDFVDEAKPYKTKVREYLSSYTKTDPTNSAITDFDLPPAYSVEDGRIVPSSLRVTDNTLVGVDPGLVTYPNKYWADNIGYEVSAILIKNGGTGYLEVPLITISGGGGTGAKAQAYIGAGGAITWIKMTNVGTGYLSAPTVVIEGTQSEGSTAAIVNAKIGNGKVRSGHIISKYDRVSGTFLITTLTQSQTFTGTASQINFNLTWPMDLRPSQITVTVDSIEALSSEYTFANIADTTKTYTRYKGRITFTEPPANNATIIVQYSKAINMLQAQDRINLFYAPTSGMLGNDIAQLVDGIDYGGVEVKSFSFSGGSGWSSEPYYTTTWDTYDNTYEDEVFQLDGSTNVFTLANPLELDTVYNVYKNGIRVDDPNYVDESNPGANVNAKMQSITGDGVATTITINEELIPTVDGDTIIFRKATSDGSFIPDPDAYDTLLQGGNLAYTSAKGILSEEIVVDGDGFVTELTSKGPEELVPGQILDTVDFKVFDRTSDGSSIVSSHNYTGDATTTEFPVTKLPASQKDIFVKVDGIILDTTQYTVNYQTKKVKITATPQTGVLVHISTMSNNGEKIIDFDRFIGDGSTSQFVTSIVYKTGLSYTLKVDGETVASDIAETDSTYETEGRVVFKLGSVPGDGAIIEYVIYDSSTQTFSQVSTEDFTGDGTKNIFTLSQIPFTSDPVSHNIIVKLGNQILNAGYNQQYTIVSQREYQLRQWQITTATVSAENVKVFLNDVELAQGITYRWDTFNGSVVLFENTGIIGDKLEIFVIDSGDYQLGYFDGATSLFVLTPNQVHLDTAPAVGEKVTVYQFSKHDIRKIERETFDVVERNAVTLGTDSYVEYHQLTKGIIRLREEAFDAEYVWVTLNKLLLTPSVDYYVTDDKKHIRIVVDIDPSDKIEVIHFTNNVIVPKFGFRIFKDMLNRTHYKRLGDNNKYTLAEDLIWSDSKIYVTNYESLPNPNKEKGIPGVLFINGERIEYYLKENGVIRQLRRGTLGTGIAELHKAGSDVFDQCFMQTMPYKDETLTQVFDADGSTKAVTVDFIPSSVNDFEIFVAGKRMRKNAISSFDVTSDLDSPEGDITLPAEFSVDGTTATITLLDTPAINSKIIVVRRIGRTWTDSGIPLHRQENNIARFLRSQEVTLPK
tara:strand:- start:51303 stop:66020 length:14718 start_codon:yes stop_codon:yes gene_type:complete